ncbi:gustatory receptor for sugar taste 43a isoform X2 [Leptinotarsa decemlineata]|uniref:gustatory receptor for sugar taste 43a isoform X2 n=1 Tax=Leptinotarsa decemlineata TaxID=7539 RepID=UPI003D306A36
MIVEDLVVSQEIFLLLEPLIRTSRIFGIFPVVLKRNGNRLILHCSYLFGIYSYILSITLAITTVTGIVKDIEKDPSESLKMKDKKTRFVACCDITIVTLVVIYGVVSLPLRMKKFWSLIICLNQANEIIPLENLVKLLKSSRYILGMVLTVALGILGGDLILWLIHSQKIGINPVVYIEYYLPFYLNYMVVIMHGLFYWHLIFFIKIRISLLNKSLIAMKKSMCMNCSFNSRDMISEINAGEFVRLYQHPSRIHIQKLEALMKLEGKIMESVDIVNGSMEFGLPMIVLSCLLHLIFTPYFLQTSKNSNSPIWIMYLILIIGHIGRLFILVEPCQSCIREKKKTTIILCQLLRCEFERPVKIMISSFILRISQFRLQFSSCGYFKINRALIIKVAGSVTTYLVILFQFNY